MITQEQIDKYKNVVINIAVILFTLVIAFNIFNAKTVAVDSLKAKISEEEKKSLEFDTISRLEKKKSSYKKLLSKKEASLVMADINDIAGVTGVKILSVKPFQNESAVDYSKDVFEVTVNAPSYDHLAKFINAIESFSNVYMVDSLQVTSLEDVEKKGLKVSLRISSVVAN